MGKVIKIQTNLAISPSYNADNIESVFRGDAYQQIEYQTLDEYNLPYGSYVTLRNYDDILFDKATQQSSVIGGSDKVYTILQSNTVPDCETMYDMFNTYYGGNCKGIVVISRSEEIYNRIVVEAEEVGSSDQKDFRITNIYLDGEYNTITEAQRQLNTDSVIVLDFDDIYPKCAKYWKEKSDNTKTSAFDKENEYDESLVNLPSFSEGFGEYEYDSGSGGGEEYNAEDWDEFSSQTAKPYTIPCGKYYLHVDGTSEENTRTIKDYNYNIFDVLFRYVYEYLYSLNIVESGDGSEGRESNTGNQIETVIVEDPSKYTFLLKTYKMYVKAPQQYVDESNAENGEESDNGETSQSQTISSPTRDGRGPLIDYFGENANPAEITSYSAKVLSVDEIKELTAEEAQEYFNNTIVHDIAGYKDKLILTEDEAKEVLVAKQITDCDKYFIISSNVGIKSPSSIQYAYYDLGNFELIRDEYTSKAGKMSRSEYKYNTNGKIVRVRQIYDQYTHEYYTISQNNSGEFPEGYPIERKSVYIRGISGKIDNYYFENSTEGEQYAEQFKEDILYAIEDGPSVVVTENLVDISY